MSAPTSPFPTRWRGRSSIRTSTTNTSSPTPRPASTNTSNRSSTGHCNAVEEVTGVPAEAIKQLAHEYATAPTAQLCWTLGITEHHNATDNVLALINLALLCGHVGRYGSGVVPVRGQNNVQGGGDMGALPNRLPGFQLVADPDLRGKFEKAWGCTIPHRPGKHISLMHEAMDEGELRALYVIGENPLQSEADAQQMERRLNGLDFMVVQDLFLTATAEIADVVLPAAGVG